MTAKFGARLRETCKGWLRRSVVELESERDITTLGSKGHMESGYQNPERLVVTVVEDHPIRAVAFSQGMQPTGEEEEAKCN